MHDPQRLEDSAPRLWGQMLRPRVSLAAQGFGMTQCRFHRRLSTTPDTEMKPTLELVPVPDGRAVSLQRPRCWAAFQPEGSCSSPQGLGGVSAILGDPREKRVKSGLVSSHHLSGEQRLR